MLEAITIATELCPRLAKAYIKMMRKRIKESVWDLELAMIVYPSLAKLWELLDELERRADEMEASRKASEMKICT
jgi:hypothetical protein